LTTFYETIIVDRFNVLCFNMIIKNEGVNKKRTGDGGGDLACGHPHPWRPDYMAAGYEVMNICRLCSKKSRVISGRIGFCAECIRERFDTVWPEIARLHGENRQAYGLPETPPKTKGGLKCSLCMHACKIGEGETGYCGLRANRGGRLTGGRPHEGNLSYYLDPLPTNCVASFVCPCGKSPRPQKYIPDDGAAHARYNMAVFYQACAFNCLYCQNYHFKHATFSKTRMPAAALANCADSRTDCICFFGGDPGPQILHALKTGRRAINRTGGPMRICFETNGALQAPYLAKIAELSMDSGGCIKIDLKAWNERVHMALCGVSNAHTLENFGRLAQRTVRRPDPPFLVASTLLVPGYVDEEEVGPIAEFIAAMNPDIPYSLLGFHPGFYLTDLPVTSRSHAERCAAAAKKAGLTRVHVGNCHLLGNAYA